jgi:hypothetical protein
MTIWYIFSCIGIMHQEKSGNPGIHPFHKRNTGPNLSPLWSEIFRKNDSIFNPALEKFIIIYILNYRKVFKQFWILRYVCIAYLYIFWIIFLKYPSVGSTIRYTGPILAPTYVRTLSISSVNLIQNLNRLPNMHHEWMNYIGHNCLVIWG